MEIHETVDKKIDAAIAIIAMQHSRKKKEIYGLIEKYLESVREKDKQLLEQLDSGEITEEQFKAKRINNVVISKKYNKMLNEVADRVNEIAQDSTETINDAIMDIELYSYQTTAKQAENDYSAIVGLAAALAILPRFFDFGELNKKKNHRYTRQGLHSIIIGELTITAPSALNIEKIANKTTKRTIERNFKWMKHNLITNANRAENKGRQCVYDVLSTLGVQRNKVWHSQSDERVRADHSAANGQRVPMDQPFIVGGYEMMFPGDRSNAPAEQWYNCRCWMRLE